MEIPLPEAKERLTDLVDAVAHGDDVVLTRDGVAVARLVPVEPTFDRAAARRAADGLRAASRGVTLDGLAIRDLLDEGRA